MSRSFRPEGIVFGLILVSLGVLWTLSNLGRVDMLEILRRWWPLSLVAWGVLELAAVVNRRAAGGPR
jgi:cell wall-active antibiotic response 4TMS protein YvqF